MLPRQPRDDAIWGSASTVTGRDHVAQRAAVPPPRAANVDAEKRSHRRRTGESSSGVVTIGIFLKQFFVFFFYFFVF